MMSCELYMSSVIEKLLSLPLQERLRRSARHWSPSLNNIIVIRKINLCSSQTGQHYCIIRMRRQRQASFRAFMIMQHRTPLVWCWGGNTKHKTHCVTWCVDFRRYERNLWEWFVSQYNQQRRNCKVVEPAICEPYTRISHRAWACNQEVSDDRRQPLMLPYDDKW